jgi:regulator of sigma E protease
VPLGGYVKISGMIDESMDKEAMKQPAQPWEFRSKPAWQRLIIMLAGVTINFILALVLFAMILFVWGEERLPVKNLKYGIATDSLANSVGLQNGDVITSVNNKPLVYLNDLPKEMVLNEKAILQVKRNGVDTNITLPSGFISNLTKSQSMSFVSPRIPVIIDSIDGDIQYKSGQLQKGDQLVGINNESFQFFQEFNAIKKKYKNEVITLKALRNGDTVQVAVKTSEEGNIGIYQKGPFKILGSEKINYSFAKAIPAGINFGIDRLKEYITGIRLLFTSKEHKVSDNLGGVISIGKTFGGTWDWQRFWTMTALFSIILAFMNILPIPALDGGHALFTLIEMITGRKPSDKFMEYAQMVGMVLLLGLMLYAFGLDIWRLFK